MAHLENAQNTFCKQLDDATATKIKTKNMTEIVTLNNNINKLLFSLKKIT